MRLTPLRLLPTFGAMDSTHPASDRHPRSVISSRWELLDLAFFTYIAAIVVLLLILGVLFGRVETPWRFIGYHLLLGLLGLGARALPIWWKHPVAELVRWWYPVILLFPSFKAIGWIIHLIHPQFIDELLISADRLLFGRDLTTWMQARAHPLLTELMYISYGSFYFFPLIVGIPLYARARRERGVGSEVEFREFMLAVSATFWFSYFHFLFTPGVGPVFWADYTVPVLRLPGGPVTALVQWVFHTLGVQGGAFPSSHVAAAFVVCGYAVRHRIAAKFMVPLTIGLALSTMYLGYHYGVDVLYGMIVAAAALWVVPRAFGRYERRVAGSTNG